MPYFELISNDDMRAFFVQSASNLVEMKLYFHNFGNFDASVTPLTGLLPAQMGHVVCIDVFTLQCTSDT